MTSEDRNHLDGAMAKLSAAAQEIERSAEERIKNRKPRAEGGSDDWDPIGDPELDDQLSCIGSAIVCITETIRHILAELGAQ